MEYKYIIVIMLSMNKILDIIYHIFQKYAHTKISPTLTLFYSVDLPSLYQGISSICHFMLLSIEYSQSDHEPILGTPIKWTTSLYFFTFGN